ncbi:MAG: pyruvate kinase [Mycoplasma sp.]
MKLIDKRTKLIGTIGPASSNINVMRELVSEGMTCIRANFSHGDFEEHLAKFVVAKEIEKETRIPISILLDTKGPEIRVGKMTDGAQEIVSGSEITVLTTPDAFANHLGTATEISVSYRMDKDVEIGDRILFDDGKLITKITDLDRNKGIIKAKVINTHVLKNNKRINLPGVDFSLPFLAEKDINDINWGIDQGITHIAASFVNSAANVKEIRDILVARKAEHIHIVAKIESQTGIDNIDEIIEASDGVMVARGDLGLEIPYYEVPYNQKRIISKCRKAGKYVIVATQMLDSMERVPQPTRAEVSDVYWATELGADSTMLSGESASGNFPIESVTVMSTINMRAEGEKYKSAQYLEDIKNFYENSIKDERNQIAYELAKKTASGEFKYAVVCSESGKLLETIAQYRPNCSIVGVVNKEVMIRQFGISYSIFPCMDSLSLYGEIRKDPSASHKALDAYKCSKGTKYLYIRRNKTIEGTY